MKIKIVSFLFLSALIFLSCEKNSTESSGSHTVSGTIVSNGAPILKASVSLDKRGDLSAESDSSGYFVIPNVPDGNYSLSVEKTNTVGSFITKTSKISVTNDLIIQSLILPKGVKLDTLEGITATSIKISWNQTDANDFREYN